MTTFDRPKNHNPTHLVVNRLAWRPCTDCLHRQVDFRDSGQFVSSQHHLECVSYSTRSVRFVVRIAISASSRASRALVTRHVRRCDRAMPRARDTKPHRRREESPAAKESRGSRASSHFERCRSCAQSGSLPRPHFRIGPHWWLRTVLRQPTRSPPCRGRSRQVPMGALPRQVDGLP